MWILKIAQMTNHVIMAVYLLDAEDLSRNHQTARCKSVCEKLISSHINSIKRAGLNLFKYVLKYFLFQIVII